MALSGKLIGLSAPALNALLGYYTQCLSGDAIRGTSYSIAGRNFTFPSPSEASQMILEINGALGILNQTRSFNVRANFNVALGKGTPGNA